MMKDFIYKMRRGDASQYLCEQLNYVGKIQPYNLRNAIVSAYRGQEQVQYRKQYFIKAYIYSIYYQIIIKIKKILYYLKKM